MKSIRNDVYDTLMATLQAKFRAKCSLDIPNKLKILKLKDATIFINIFYIVDKEGIALFWKIC